MPEMYLKQYTQSFHTWKIMIRLQILKNTYCVKNLRLGTLIRKRQCQKQAEEIEFTKVSWAGSSHNSSPKIITLKAIKYKKQKRKSCTNDPSSSQIWSKCIQETTVCTPPQIGNWTSWWKTHVIKDKDKGPILHLIENNAILNLKLLFFIINLDSFNKETK